MFRAIGHSKRIAAMLASVSMMAVTAGLTGCAAVSAKPEPTEMTDQLCQQYEQAPLPIIIVQSREETASWVNSCAVLSFRMNTQTGRPYDVTVVSSNDPEYAEALREALPRWGYNPNTFTDGVVYYHNEHRLERINKSIR